MSFKLDLIGKVGSWKINKNIIRNTACLKKGNTYGYLKINWIDMLKICALHMTFIIALMHLVAVGGINTFLFQCEYNENDTIASYVRGNYDFF